MKPSKNFNTMRLKNLHIGKKSSAFFVSIMLITYNINAQVGLISCPEGTIPLGPWGCYLPQQQGNRLILTYMQRYNSLQASCEVIDQLGYTYVVCSGNRDDWEECSLQLKGNARYISRLRETANHIMAIRSFIEELQNILETIYDILTLNIQDIVVRMVSDAIAKTIIESLNKPTNPANEWIKHGYGFIIPGLSQQLGVEPHRIKIRWDQSTVYIGECVLAQIHSGLMAASQEMDDFLVQTASRIFTSGAICGLIGGAVGAAAGSVLGGGGAIPGAMAGAKIAAKGCVIAEGADIISEVSLAAIQYIIHGAAKGMDVVPARLVIEIY